MTPYKALEKAIATCGGQTALARAIGGKVRQGHVWQWLNHAGRAPSEHCLAIELAVKRAVTRYDLRPDVFGAAPKDLANAAA